MAWPSCGQPDLPVHTKYCPKIITLCDVWSSLQLACMVVPNHIPWFVSCLGPTIAAPDEYTADCNGWWKCDDHLLREKAGGHPTSVRVAVKEETHHWHWLWSYLIQSLGVPRQWGICRLAVCCLPTPSRWCINIVTGLYMEGSPQLQSCQSKSQRDYVLTHQWYFLEGACRH